MRVSRGLSGLIKCVSVCVGIGDFLDVCDELCLIRKFYSFC